MRRLAGLALALLLPAAAAAADVILFAASSLKDALDDAARTYQSATNDRIVASYAASNALARQVENGAPADVFISADADWVNYLEQRGLTRAGSRVNLLSNDLVLIAPASSTARVKIVPGVDISGMLRNKRIALADPDAVPAGKYAKAAFTKLGIWGAVQGRVAPADSARAALTLVARGEAPLGVVYRTDALEEPAVRIVDTFPRDTHPAIIYPMVRLKHESAAGDRFAAWLRTAPARAIFERHGFQVT